MSEGLNVLEADVGVGVMSWEGVRRILRTPYATAADGAVLSGLKSQSAPEVTYYITKATKLRYASRTVNDVLRQFALTGYKFHL